MNASTLQLWELIDQLPEKLQHEVALQFVDRVIHIYEQVWSDGNIYGNIIDHRTMLPQIGLKAKRSWIDGDMDSKELERFKIGAFFQADGLRAKGVESYSEACLAAMDAAFAMALCATSGPGWAVARAVAHVAADAEMANDNALQSGDVENWQIKIVLDLIRQWKKAGSK